VFDRFFGKIFAECFPDRRYRHNAGFVKNLELVSPSWTFSTEVSVNRDKALDVCGALIERLASFSRGHCLCPDGNHLTP
jgi:hypothetical protein